MELFMERSAATPTNYLYQGVIVGFYKRHSRHCPMHS